jgi:hypothetical protein
VVGTPQIPKKCAPVWIRALGEIDVHHRLNPQPSGDNVCDLAFFVSDHRVKFPLDFVTANIQVPDVSPTAQRTERAAAGRGERAGNEARPTHRLRRGAVPC